MNINLINENYTSEYTKNLLRARGIDDFDGYINPNAKCLQDPTDLAHIGIGAALYLRIVLQNRPKILLIVDPDLDGFTSAAIMYLYTKQVNCHAQIDFWVHQGKQHGLSDHIGRLLDEGVEYDLLIAPDSSSNDKSYHDMLEDIHLPVLVLDHHITDIELSDNAVIINNQLSPNYHNKELTGAGVVYQFCRFLDSRLHQNWAEEYVDLAALGIK